MNKEEIKKAIKIVFYENCKKCYFPRRKCANCIKENGKKIKAYIKHLEQKESILDKVTDLATKIATKIATENAEKYNSKSQKEVDFSEWNLALEILNIIEGENHE